MSGFIGLYIAGAVSCGFTILFALGAASADRDGRYVKAWFCAGQSATAMFVAMLMIAMAVVQSTNANTAAHGPLPVTDADTKPLTP